MERYKNLGGDSNVESYEIGDSYVKVKFKGTTQSYVYTHARPGQRHVDAMKQLAVKGHGLQSYINCHRSMGYERKES